MPPHHKAGWGGNGRKELRNPTGLAAHGQSRDWPTFPVLLGGQLAFSSCPGGWLGFSVEPWQCRE